MEKINHIWMWKKSTLFCLWGVMRAVMDITSFLCWRHSYFPTDIMQWITVLIDPVQINFAIRRTVRCSNPFRWKGNLIHSVSLCSVLSLEIRIAVLFNPANKQTSPAIPYPYVIIFQRRVSSITKEILLFQFTHLYSITGHKLCD